MWKPNALPTEVENKPVLCVCKRDVAVTSEPLDYRQGRSENSVPGACAVRRAEREAVCS